MKKLDIIQTASSNLWRNKTRSILTIIAILIGSATLSVTNGIGDGIKSYLNRQIGNLGANNTLIISVASGTEGATSSEPEKYNPDRQTASTIGGGANTGLSNFVLTKADIEKISATPGIVSVRPTRPLSADYVTTEKAKDKYTLTIQEQYSDDFTLDMAAGRQVSIANLANEIVLPSKYVSVLGYADANEALNTQATIQVKNAVGIKKEYPVTIVGIMRASFFNGDNSYVSRSLADQVYEYQTAGIPAAQKEQYAVALASFDKSFTQAQTDDLKLALKEKGYQGQTIKDQSQLVFNAIDAIVIVFNLFGIIALIAAAFGIINTLFMAVQERTKEIGLMKAVGSSRRTIFALFSLEAVLLGFWGSVIGIGIAYGFGAVANRIALQGFLKDFEGLVLIDITPQAAITIVLVIMTIAFLAGTLPARRAGRLNPIDALRYE
jgi:putative ABC transport system permease protein